MNPADTAPPTAKIASHAVAGGPALKRRNIADLPKTKASGLMLLSRLMAYYKLSGKPNQQRFDEPDKAHDLAKKLHTQVFNRWLRDSTEPTKVKFRGRRGRIRRMRTPKRDVVPMLRHAVPKVYKQGFLRTRVETFPYRPGGLDTFLPHHLVNVFQIGGRFDVIDANGNLTVKAGITERELKTIVEWR